MAASGSKNFTVTRDDIIESALKIVSVYDPGEAVPAAELSDAAQRLNLIAKEWTTEGISMPLREQTILFLNYKTQRYELGNVGTTGTTDNFHFIPSSALLENAVFTAEEASGQTTIACDDDLWVDSEGKSVSKNTSADDTLTVGIRQNDLTIHWSTQSSQTTDEITLAAATTDEAAVGNKIYAYLTASRQPRPTKLLYAYRSDTSRNDSQIEIIGRIAYETLSGKDSSGPPTQVHFAQTVRSWSAGESAVDLYVWPVKNPSNVDKIVMVTEHYIDDFDAATDNLQLPVEYGNALIWCLASELSYEYGVDERVRREIKTIAEAKKSTVLDAFDVENASFRMSREYSGRRR